MKIIYILAGLPASGKSTWAKNQKEYLEGRGYSTEIVSTDAIRGELYGNESIQGNRKLVFDTAYKKIEANLNPLGMTDCIIFDATNLHRRNRGAFLRKFKKNNVTIVLVYFDIHFSICELRNKARNRVVPPEVMERMWKNKDVPTLDEEFDEFLVVRA